ncbi:uncharacterized protein [Diadema antillarum]|uniref:uncharacterized protein n=1 Tax=Diadema antillarum TaxID=105358 RepID=UPI003A83AA81
MKLVSSATLWSACVAVLAAHSAVAAFGLEHGDDVRVDTSKALYFRDVDSHVERRSIHRVNRDTVVDLPKTLWSSSSSTSMRIKRSHEAEIVHSRKRRSTDFTTADAEAIVAKHNEGRGMVSPEAADMKRMTWNDELANMAQTWSDGCYYEHGNPANTSPFNPVGQNLYIRWGLSQPGTPPDGTDATQAWYNEYQYYDYATGNCQAGEQCGHYTQNVWASTYAVGCGLTFCSQATDASGNTYNGAWLITCNYGPAGNYVGQKPYTTGASCTKCESGQGLCQDNLCTDCSPSTDEGCECKAVCNNCGSLNNDCSCTCADGWYGSDCATPCEDTHANCGANPGWPVSWCDRSYVINGCPLMCSLCTDCSPSTDEGCECKAVCNNCGSLNNDCSCTCADGWYGSDCATPCEDTHANCGANPGWPVSWCDRSYVINGCPLMCSLCNAADPNFVCNSDIQDENGVLIQLNEDITKWDEVKAAVLSEFRASVVSYCTNAPSECCPALNNTVVNFSPMGLTLSEGYPMADDTNPSAYWIQVTGISPVAAGVCQAGDGKMMNPDVVLAAIQEDTAALETRLNIDIGESKHSSATTVLLSIPASLLTLAMALWIPRN